MKLAVDKNVMRRFLKFIFISLFAILNMGALPPSRNAFSSTEQAQKIISVLRSNKMKFLEQKNPNEKVISIYDRLIFVLNSRYAGGDVIDFLSEYCITLAEIEQRDKKPLLKFYAHLSDVIRNAKIEREDVATAIENYIHAAPVTEPLTAARFIMNHSYSNGKNGQRAFDMTSDNLVLATDDPVTESKKVTDFEFSREIEEWFAEVVSITESKEPQTSEQDSQKIPPSEQSTIKLDTLSPSDKPALSTVTPLPPTQSSQTRPASTSEPITETK